MTISHDSTPRLYVGTYAKYNSGSIAGAWVDLEDYTDKDAFLAAARELHKDEADPELMYQDFEGFPRGLYNESYVSAELFDWIALDNDDRKLLEVYQEGVDQSGTIEQAREAFVGTASSEADWAEEYLRETGGLEGVPKHLENYIDFEAYARDARLNGMYFVRHDGELWVFAPC